MMDTRGKGAGGSKSIRGAKYMVIEDDLTLGVGVRKIEKMNEE